MCTRALCKLSNAVHGTLGQNPSPSQREINGWAPQRNPEGMPAMLLVSPFSGLESQECHLILFDIHSCSSIQSYCSFCLVIFVIMVHSPDFFPDKTNMFSFRCRLFFFLDRHLFSV